MEVYNAMAKVKLDRSIKIDNQLSILTLFRIIKSFIFNPIHSFRVERKEWEKFFARRKLEKLGFGVYLDSKKIRNDTIGPDWADLLNIYSLVRIRKPEIVVELGSGFSTVAFSKALYDNYLQFGIKGKLYSFDGDKNWLSNTKKYFPEELSDYCEFRLGEEEEHSMYGEKVRAWANRNGLAPQFLYIDGLDKISDSLIGAEALFLEAVAPGDFFILVDGRGPTCRFLEKHLKLQYKIIKNSVHYWSSFERVSRNTFSE